MEIGFHGRIHSHGVLSTPAIWSNKKSKDKTRLCAGFGCWIPPLLNPFRSLTSLEKMLQEDVLPVFLERRDFRRMYFQPHAAPAHTASQVISWLEETFSGRVIRRKSVIPWPAYSPDLYPLDFWFWGHGNDMIQKEDPKTIVDLVVLVTTFSLMLGVSNLENFQNILP